MDLAPEPQFRAVPARPLQIEVQEEADIHHSVSWGEKGAVKPVTLQERHPTANGMPIQQVAFDRFRVAQAFELGLGTQEQGTHGREPDIVPMPEIRSHALGHHPADSGVLHRLENQRGVAPGGVEAGDLFPFQDQDTAGWGEARQMIGGGSSGKTGPDDDDIRVHAGDSSTVFSASPAVWHPDVGRAGKKHSPVVPGMHAVGGAGH
jgi:hypothetical protein